MHANLRDKTSVLLGRESSDQTGLDVSSLAVKSKACFSGGSERWGVEEASERCRGCILQWRSPGTGGGVRLGGCLHRAFRYAFVLLERLREV